MNFDMDEAIELLERTPASLEALLSGLSKGWLTCNEGEGTWTATEVIGHLIEAERTNWIVRMETILRENSDKKFPPFDRFAHLSSSGKSSIEELLIEFKAVRADNIKKLKTLVDPAAHLELKGTHPEFGEVKLRELISTWVLHDLTHIHQITRVMAERYRSDVGPWENYLGILHRK